MLKRKFTKITLDSLLEEIVDAYFDDCNTLTLEETIDYVKGCYRDEISTLEDGPIWI